MPNTILKNGTTPVEEIKAVVNDRLKGVGKLKKEVKGLRGEFDEFLKNYDTGDPDAPRFGGVPVDDFKPGSSFNKISDTHLSMEMNIGEAEKFYKQINDNSPPKGSGVLYAMGPDIWQEKLESFDWGNTIPRQLVQTDMKLFGTAQSVKISGLKHDVIADGKDPTESGTAAATSHVLDTRKTLVKIGTSALSDVQDLPMALERLALEIYQNEKAKATVAVLDDSNGAKVKTGQATGLPTTANAITKLVELMLSIKPQYRAGSVMLIHDEILKSVYAWASTAASARGISDFLGGNIETNFANRRLAATSLVKDGTTASDKSAFCFDPSVLRIYEHQNLTGSLLKNPANDAWYFAVTSRFKVSVLDETGIAYFSSEA